MKSQSELIHRSVNMLARSVYGVQITNGKNQADIHGTTLAMWALSMITNNIEDDRVNLELNLIKP